MIKSTFTKQLELLLRVLPYVVENDRLALKGGSAINLFVRNLPRLSVDIDLSYIVIEDRETSLNNLSQILQQTAQKISAALPNVSTIPQLSNAGRIRKLIINGGGAIIKVEPNETIRGTVFPCQIKDLCQKAQDEFELFLSARTLSLADLYGGKICAALDRQHPRDLFDVKLLLENEGITEEIRKAFLVYLISHNRPMYEVLNPNLLDQEGIFNREFQGMSTVKVTYLELCQVRDTLIGRLHSELTSDERRFLLSFKRREPDWSLLGIEGVDKLPGVKWKLQNLEKMSSAKHSLAVEKLKDVLRL